MSNLQLKKDKLYMIDTLEENENNNHISFDIEGDIVDNQHTNDLPIPSFKKFKKWHLIGKPEFNGEGIKERKKYALKLFKNFRPYNIDIIKKILPFYKEKWHFDALALLSLCGGFILGILSIIYIINNVDDAIDLLSIIPIVVAIIPPLMLTTLLFEDVVLNIKKNSKINKFLKDGKINDDILNIVENNHMLTRWDNKVLNLNKGWKDKYNGIQIVNWEKAKIKKKENLINSHPKSKKILDMWKRAGDVRMREFIYLYYFTKEYLK